MQLIDHLILDSIYLYGTIHDFSLAGRLRCSRTFLLERLERLLSQRYLLLKEDGGFSLSEKGQAERIPFEAFQLENSQSEPEPVRFDWTELYIPEPEWFNQ